MNKLILILIVIAYPLFSQGITSNEGRALIKHFEGLRLTAYRCPANVLTIGWGHTGGVKTGEKITLKQAEQFLIKDLKRFENHINSNAERELMYNEFDALVSFCYNCGYRFKGELAEACNLRQTKRFEILFKQYCHVGSSVNKGLQRRRAIEFVVYDKGIYP
jgi:lysozyme